MIPELGIIPPQAGYVDNKFGNLSRGKSQPQFRSSSRAMNRHQLNPSIAKKGRKFDSIDPLNYSKPVTEKEDSFMEYNSPNFMPRIKKNISATNYKARTNGLYNRSKNSNSISHQRDTTILGTKSIIIESETEEIARESQIAQSQAVNMQNTINLVSDSDSDASTHKQSKKDQNELRNDKTKPSTKKNSDPATGITTHKRNKNSKIQEIEKEGNSQNIDYKEYKILPAESKQLEKVPNVGSKAGKKLSQSFSKHKPHPEMVGKDHRRKKSSLKNHLETGYLKAAHKYPSNQSSLHNVNADEHDERAPFERTDLVRGDPLEEKSLVKNNGIKQALQYPEEEGKSSNLIYVKQKIESFKDKNHSQKIEEKEMEFQMSLKPHNTQHLVPLISQTHTSTKPQAAQHQSSSKFSKIQKPEHFQRKGQEYI